MAQYSINAYDADVFIPEFKGLMQYGDQMGTDLRFSPDCMNVETPGGVLQPAAKLKNVLLMIDDSTELAWKDNTTIMYCRATNISVQPYNGSKVKYMVGNVETAIQVPLTAGKEYDLYLIVCGQNLYAVRLNEEYPDYKSWTKVYVSAVNNTEYANKHWSWCTYEHIFPSTSEIPGGPTGKTNILVLGNETNGMFYYIDGFSTQIFSIASVPATFGHIARYAERIWGIGVGQNKDTLYYSRPFSVTNWTQDDADPANGGGEIREATFDSDKLVALVPFGDALIAFSEQRAWRISGTDPSNFSIQEQYGNGTRYPRSIAVLGERIIMLGDHGLVSYDGYRVIPFMKEATYEIFREWQITSGSLGTPVGIAVEGKYILALCNKNYKAIVSGSSVFVHDGYMMLTYDDMTGSITAMNIPYITDLCVNPPFAWALTTDPVSTTSERMCVAKIRFDSWYLQDITGNAVKWTTPWITLGRKDVQKGGFELYFNPELSEDATTGIKFTFSIQTEKKTKMKEYTVQPLTAAQKAAGKGYKPKKLHFGGAGRKFRLIIETDPGDTTPWRLVGGIHIVAEIDKD